MDLSAASNLETIDQNFDALTGSIGITHKFRQYLLFNMNIAQAFRAPNLSDLTKLGESKGDTYEIPNTTLEPEKMLSIDGGIKLNRSNLKGNLSVYYTRITDLLASASTIFSGSPIIVQGNDTLLVRTKKNIGDAVITGFESTIHYSINKYISLTSNLTYTYGENRSLNEPVGGIPPIFGLAGIQWGRGKYNIYFYSRFAGKQDRLSEDDKIDTRIPVGGTPGWQTHNVRFRTNISEQIRFQFSIENIFDYNYREHGSGINGPGRNFILSFNIRT